MAEKRRMYLGVILGAIAAAGALYPGLQSGNPSKKETLEAILKKTGDYCARLDLAALYFVCVEDVTEKIFEPYRVEGSFRGFETELDKYIYDFQMIHKGAIEERRILLRENDTALNLENAPLKTKRFYYKYLVFGPLGLFGFGEQPHYRYTLDKEEKLWGRPAIVVQAVPVTAADSQWVWGKAWIDAAEGSVMRIEWAEESIENYAGIREFAVRLNAKANLKFSSEFRFEKNGIRFPSRFTMREDYRQTAANLGARVLQKSELLVDFHDYKFFTVDVEAKIIR